MKSINNIQSAFEQSYWEFDFDLFKDLLLKFADDNSTFLLLIFSDNRLWGSLILEIDDGKIIKLSRKETEYYYQKVKDYRFLDWRKGYKGLLDLLKPYLSQPLCNGLFMTRKTLFSIIKYKTKLYDLVEAIVCKDIITEPPDFLERTLFN